jgi:predicted GIY-YIG superfamily endonuclease
MYSIYKITSPSGRSYIGLTKTPVKERWAQHVKRAKTDGKNHPFYNAIRKYGKSAFTVETIDTASDKQAAQSLEQGKCVRTTS